MKYILITIKEITETEIFKKLKILIFCWGDYSLTKLLPRIQTTMTSDSKQKRIPDFFTSNANKKTKTNVTKDDKDENNNTASAETSTTEEFHASISSWAQPVMPGDSSGGYGKQQLTGLTIFASFNWVWIIEVA